jgi:hypothetical protein
MMLVGFLVFAIVFSGYRFVRGVVWWRESVRLASTEGRANPGGLWAALGFIRDTFWQ